MSIALAVAITSLTSQGCGASYQAMYEGELRFEHCYRLDQESSVRLDDKRACWRAWTKRYRRGQSRDRYDYALKRQRELDAQLNGTAPPPHLDNNGQQLAAADPSSGLIHPPVQVPGETSPPGTNVMSEPPQALAPPPMTGGTPSPLLSPPNALCTDSCKGGWTLCSRGCDGLPQPSGCRRRCDLAYRSCVRGCVQ